MAAQSAGHGYTTAFLVSAVIFVVGAVLTGVLLPSGVLRPASQPSPRSRSAEQRRRSPTHDYVRHGTTTLFAALEVATGKVTDACYPRHRHQEFLAFLQQVAKTYPRVKLHIVLDNYATHKHPAVKAWLANNPRITLHFTPTSGS